MDPLHNKVIAMHTIWIWMEADLELAKSNEIGTTL